jgi:hypothetical protein
MTYQVQEEVVLFSNSNTANAMGTEQFTKFWSDMMSQMSGAGFGTMFEGSRESAEKAMRQAFFDAWQRHCEEFMRSDAFLASMKTSMDNALSFREQMNKFVSDAMNQGPLPTKTDTDSILQVLHGLEARVLDQMQRMTTRIESLEARLGNTSAAANRASTTPNTSTTKAK